MVAFSILIGQDANSLTAYIKKAEKLSFGLVFPSGCFLAFSVSKSETASEIGVAGIAREGDDVADVGHTGDK